MIPSPKTLEEGSDHGFEARVRDILATIGRELATQYVPGKTDYELKLSVSSQFYLGHSAWLYVETKLRKSAWIVVSVDASNPCAVLMQIKVRGT